MVACLCGLSLDPSIPLFLARKGCTRSRDPALADGLRVDVRHMHCMRDTEVSSSLGDLQRVFLPRFVDAAQRCRGLIHA